MEDRKNWKGLVEAFLTEFDASEDVRLYIKTRPCGWCGYEYPKDSVQSFAQRLQRRQEEPIRDAVERVSGKNPQVVVMDDEISLPKLVQLYKAADAFVLPTHGEGWGLTLMEGMAMALPTIGTNWGGNTAFMTTETSLLIDVKKMAPGFDGFNWAEPDPQLLQGAMRGLFLQPAAGRALGRRARAHIAQHFGRAPINKILKARLDALRYSLPQASSAPAHSTRLNSPERSPNTPRKSVWD